MKTLDYSFNESGESSEYGSKSNSQSNTMTSNSSNSDDSDSDVDGPKKKKKKSEREKVMDVIRSNPADFGVRRSSRGNLPNLSESSNSDSSSGSDSDSDDVVNPQVKKPKRL